MGATRVRGENMGYECIELLLTAGEKDTKRDCSGANILGELLNTMKIVRAGSETVEYVSKTR